MASGTKRSGTREGSALLVATMAIAVLLTLGGAMMMVALRAKSETSAAVFQQRAQLAADAGVAQALVNLTFGDDSDVGAPGQELPFSGGSYWAQVTDQGDGTYVVAATGTVQNETVSVEAHLTPGGFGIYDNAIFAGNVTEDPLYELGLGGTGGQADDIFGDVYCAGDVMLAGDAKVSGMIRAGRSVLGADGEDGVDQPIPDLVGMNYADTGDIDVAGLFAAASYQYDEAGGRAWQLPETSPAHVFRKNPSDRSTETSSTAKDDYFLEDPYEPLRVDRNQNGRDAYHLTFPPGVNQKVFYIDGNLWLHNKKSYSFKFYQPEYDGLQMTIVVRGNIYFSDNLFYLNKNKDGVAFIAMKDEGVEDSGNIYFGDPRYGTLKEMNAFMYAENNFYDVNLDASGSSQIRVYGNMTAGNQVLVKRDYGDSHTKLTVDFDDRIASGRLDMPGLPSMSGDLDRYSVVSWRRVPNP